MDQVQALLAWAPFVFTATSLFYLLATRQLTKSTGYASIHDNPISLSTPRDLVLAIVTFLQLVAGAFLLGWRVEPGSSVAFWWSLAKEGSMVAAWIYALGLLLLTFTHKIERATSLLQLQCFYAITLTIAFADLSVAVHDICIGQTRLSLGFFLDTLVGAINCAVLFWAAITMPQEPDENLAQETVKSYASSGYAPSPEATASVYSAVTFSWLNALIQLGNRKTLGQGDLPDLLSESRSKFVWHQFLQVDTYHQLLHRLILYNLPDLSLQFFAALISTIFEFVPPYFLGLFLTYIDDPTTATRDQAYFYVLLMFLVQLLRTVVQSQMFFLGRRVDIRLKAILNAEIYAKSLRRRNTISITIRNNHNPDPLVSTLGATPADRPADTGKITNLMSVDAGRVAQCANNSYLAVTSPLSIIIGGYMLYRWLGWSFVVGLATAVAMQPFSSWVTVWYSGVQKKLLAARDERITLTNELLQGIRMIKFFAWERPFSERILLSREFELGKLFSVYIASTLLNFIYQSTPLLITFLSFVAFTKLAHGELTAPIAFTSIVLFDKLRWPLLAIPTFITAFVDGAASLRRIEDFLNEPEIDTSPSPSLTPTHNPIVGFKAATLAWFNTDPFNDNRFTLRDLDIVFPLGVLSVVCGPTGSGKTALLMALLGEMDLLAGKVFLPRSGDGRRTIDIDSGLIIDRVAFVAEQAWLQNATVRENILFGQPLEEERYAEVLKVCALENDLEVWEDGDLTEIGERGITLSGGQKQRVALARAVYSRARHVLLDDCFSAVDTHTAQYIHRHCIHGNLMRDRTVILVTHHLRLCLPTAAYVVKLEHGRAVVAANTAQLPEAVRKSLMEIEDQRVLVSGNTPVVPSSPWQDDLFDEDPMREGAEGARLSPPRKLGEPVQKLAPLKRPFLNRVPTVTLQPASPIVEQYAHAGPDQGSRRPHMLVEEERRESGGVQWFIYRFYVDAAGTPLYWAVFVVIFVLFRVLNVAEGWWLKVWSAAYTNEGEGAGNGTAPGQAYDAEALYEAQVDVNYYLGVYALIAIASIASPIATAYKYVGSLAAARVLHQRMLGAVVRAPLRVYDTVPVGRILNRFSKDLETIDTQLMSNCGEFLSTALSVISIVIVVSIATPLFLVAAFFVGLLYWRIAQLYNSSSRELKRLDSTSKSPIFSQFGETIIGVTTIRAFGEQSRFMSEMLVRIDDGLRAYYAYRAANRWLAIRADFIGALIALLAGLLILIFPNSVDAGLAGLSLTYALNFVYQMNWLVRAYTNTELNLTSVERVHEYVVMPQEPPGIILNARPPVWWPHDGRIEIKGLVVQYAPDLENVIRGISFDVRAKERIGIVGRTGSGKSTLALSLFRFVEPTAGAIIIDGIDISSIGLEDLRSRFTIVPQDPILLSGNVRSNLDPFNEYTEDEIWESLYRVQLADAESRGGDGRATADLGAISLIATLDDPVSEGGRNFSQGQRQLLCLARALLRNSKIIVMDEATASVDFTTDRNIQDTIRQEFEQSTFLCIAHRLRTVIDYDRVLVLDQGRVVEYDTPYNLLLNREDTAFRRLCEASGEMDSLVEAATLRKLSGGR